MVVGGWWLALGGWLVFLGVEWVAAPRQAGQGRGHAAEVTVAHTPAVLGPAGIVYTSCLHYIRVSTLLNIYYWGIFACDC